MEILYRSIADILLFAVRERHHGPFATPGPFARLRATPVGLLAKLLVLASRQTDHGVSFAGPECQNTDTRLRPHRTNGGREWGRGVPLSLDGD